jgi:hypothetical protein
MAEKSFREWTPGKSYLLPPSPMEWSPQGRLAHSILEIVGELDFLPPRKRSA